MVVVIVGGHGRGRGSAVCYQKVVVLVVEGNGWLTHSGCSLWSGVVVCEALLVVVVVVNGVDC